MKPYHSVLIKYPWSLCSSGGETIKNINQQSGAHVELQRNPPLNTDPNVRIFSIRGTPQQMEMARQLIDEKIGVGTKSFVHVSRFFSEEKTQDVLTFLLREDALVSSLDISTWRRLPSGLHCLALQVVKSVQIAVIFFFVSSVR